MSSLAHDDITYREIASDRATSRLRAVLIAKARSEMTNDELLAEAAARHAKAFTAEDLLDEIAFADDDTAASMLEAVQAGDAAAVGRMVIALFTKRVQARAQWGAAS